MDTHTDHEISPDPSHGGPLVQPEGVQAGSARSTDESPATVADADLADAIGSVGAVEGAADTPDPRTDRSGTPDHADGELLGAAGTQSRDPGQEEAASGQDSGSMT